VPPLVQGRIVYSKVPIPDPQGRNPKPRRPFVVITRTEDIAASGIQAVGITDELSESPADHYVALPWGAHARTGLTKKCAALCTWLINTEPHKVEIGSGHVSAKYVLAIIEKVKFLHQSKD
jgi:hypothetical protein